MEIQQVEASFSFEDVTDIAGMTYQGFSWGSTWGDFDVDGFPDLWVSNHESGSLFHNNGNGTFSDVTSKIILGNITGDLHGSSWADFDNDGDQDLIVLTGAERGLGQGSNFFLINNNGKLADNATLFGLDYPLGRGRTPLWFDYDNDGLLDVIFGNSPRTDVPTSAVIFLQTTEGFIEDTERTGLKVNDHVGSILLSDISGDQSVELVVMNPIPQGIFAIDILVRVVTVTVTPDVFFVRAAHDISVVDKISEKKIGAHLVQKGHQSFSFQTLGELKFDIRTFVPRDTKIYIGSEGLQPPENQFTLSPEDPNVLGTYKNKTDFDNGIFIEYDKITNTWTFLHSSKDPSHSNIVIESTQPILQTNFKQLEASKIYQDDKLFFNSKNGFNEVTSISGLKNPTSCRSVVAGDFYNDMYVHIYLVCSTFIKNLPNIFYENQGNGFFKAIENSGAEGSLNGIGDSATTVDYDSDGFLDLFVTNGFELPPFSSDGPNQLFRNIGNNNHWLEIDLEGKESNRDGVGARIFVTSGDITQLREQNAGMHYASQNHQRIHFGLAENEIIDNIVVFWPSGMINELTDVNTDQILKIIEPTTLIPPNHQTRLGIDAEQVKCKEELELIFKLSNGKASCVKPASLNLLIERGWGQIKKN